MIIQKHRRKKILIVEDDPFIAMDLEDAFLFAGFTVLGPVAQVTAGLKIVETHRPDIAALDYNLGNETSTAIAKALSKMDVPYVFVTGQIERVVQDNDLKHAPLFSKPYNPAELVDAVSSMLAA